MSENTSALRDGRDWDWENEEMGAPKRAPRSQPRILPTGLLKPKADQYTGLYGNELFVVVNDDLLEKLTFAAREVGGWAALSTHARVSQRWLRRIRGGKRQCRTVGMRALDRVFTRVGCEHLMRELTWYTPLQLVEMGVWRPQPDLNDPEVKKYQRKLRAQRRRAMAQEQGEQAEDTLEM